MKKFMIGVAAALAVVGAAGAAWSAEGARPVVEFNMPEGFFQEVCKQPVWKGVSASWGGVTDGRGQHAIGTQEKGDEEIAVNSEPALAVVMNDALKDLFEACGLALVEKKADALALSAQIVAFDVSVIKKTVSSKTAAESLLRFTLEKGGKSATVDVGMEMDSKGIRRGSIKSLANAANKLLLETLREIPKSDHLRALGDF